MNDDQTGGYVHRPRDDTGGAPRSDGSEESVASERSAAAESDSFGARGWILVGSLTLSMLVIPGVIYLYPSAPSDAGLSFFAAMLVLPLVPAVLLGLTAVWSMTAATDEE
ncbi:MAG: hypothetical protein ACOCR0_03420 [Haloferacaceae archaeon]